MHPNHAPAYRPDIDGLRAVAVSSVVVFHLFPGWLPGGFVGVDVFFVISGFLITSIVFQGVAAGDFSLGGFYVRRVLRIFPALALVLAACLVAGRLGSFAFEFRHVAEQVAAGAAFVANLLFWREAGYFDAAAELKPLLHLWSLGVEEQFYLLWPLAAGLLGRRPRALLGLIALVLVASFAANLALVASQPSAAFYLPVTRFWELMVGALLAWSVVFGPGLPGRAAGAAVANWASLAGAGLLAVALFAVHKSDPFPGARALLPTVGAALLIAGGPGAWPNRIVLASRPFVFVGLISYPLYLWHWPVLSFLRIESDDPLGRTVKLVALGASVLLAWATWRFVERPLRAGAAAPGSVRRRTFALCSVVAALGACGLAAAHWVDAASDQERFVESFDDSEPAFRYAVAHDLFAEHRHDCNFYDVRTNRARDTIAAGCYTPTGAHSVILWGDSFAQHLGRSLQRSMPADVSLLQVATSGCTPRIRPAQPDAFGACNRSNAFLLDTVARVHPDVVLIAQQHHHDSTDWQEVSRELHRRGAVHVVLLGPFPQWTAPLYRVVARNFWPTPPARIDRYLDGDVFATDRAMRARFGGSGDIQYLSMIDRLCDAHGCLAFLGPDVAEDIVTFDYGHLTPRAAAWVSRTFIAPTLLADVGQPANRPSDPPAVPAGPSQ